MLRENLLGLFALEVCFPDLVDLYPWIRALSVVPKGCEKKSYLMNPHDTEVTDTTGPFFTGPVMPGGLPHQDLPTATLQHSSSQPHPVDWTIYPEIHSSLIVPLASTWRL